MADLSFDWMTLDGIECQSGHSIIYPPAIASGRWVDSECSGPEEEQGPTIDDYRLYCRRCEIYVSESYGSCPNDLGHRLVARSD